MRNDITIRPETQRDHEDIAKLIIRSFSEGTDYSDGTDVVALVEEIRDSQYCIPELSFVAELNGNMAGHFMFSRFPISETKDGKRDPDADAGIVMLGPVSVHADHLRQGIGTTMLTMGINEVKKRDFRGITVEGNHNFYNTLGFRTSSEYNIYPTSGFSMKEPRYMMCQETYPGSLRNIKGFIVYDMYRNA